MPYHIILLEASFWKGRRTMKGHDMMVNDEAWVRGGIENQYVHQENTPILLHRHIAGLTIQTTDCCHLYSFLTIVFYSSIIYFFLKVVFTVPSPFCTALLIQVVICSWNASGLSPLTWHIDKVFWLRTAVGCKFY